MLEQKILAACIDSRSNWDSIREHVILKDFDPESVLLYQLITDFYEADPKAQKVDTDILQARISRASWTKDMAQQVLHLYSTLPVDVSGINVVEEALHLKRHRLGLRIAKILTQEGADRSAAKELMSEYASIGAAVGSEDDEEVLAGPDIETFAGKSFDKSNLIQIAPRSLNDHLDGGARPGHHILVFAPTEMGKTLFVVNMVSHFLHQNLKVLYIANEDPSADIMMRVINRLTGMNKYEVIENPKKAQEICNKKNYQNLILASLAPGTFSKIESLCDKYEPSVVILDQLRNLDVNSENRTQALEQAATSARNLAKSRNLVVVSVTQAGDSASGKRVLRRGDVDGSNVGIPGQCDVMIGIGADEEMEAQNIRMLSFPKNKLSGKHAPITVSIDPAISKVVDHV